MMSIRARRELLEALAPRYMQATRPEKAKRYPQRFLREATRAAITTVIVITFIGSWNNFLGPLVFLNTMEKHTVSLGMQWSSGVAGHIRTFGRPTEPLMMAASFVAALPPLLIFVFAQRYFVEGIVTTGFKGAGA